MPGAPLAHAGRRATAFGRRAARTLARRGPRPRPDEVAVEETEPARPEISVIVPFYNVEDYVADCLDSILSQDFGDFELLLVDDGSQDGSRAVAERYAASDERVRIVTRENGGLGAARNTGVREARARYLTFVDSDDELPPGALEALHSSARRTGSDVVAGAIERFDRRRTWLPTWCEDVHATRREGVTIDDFVPLLRNLYTWNKLFRRDFWDAQDLWFREGVSYEDQPIITQLYARAASIDVIPELVYRYRLRDDRSSISQQTATLHDLRDRIAAWRTTREALHGNVSPAVYQGWLQTLFEAHFQWYLASPGTADNTYWTELVSAIRSLAAEASEQVWAATSPPQRVLVRLALLDRREDVLEFLQLEGKRVERWPARLDEEGILLELPFFDDPDLPRDLFRLHPEQARVVHAVENLHWMRRDDGPRLWISGWAYLSKVDLSDRTQRVTVELRQDGTDDVRTFDARAFDGAAYAVPREDHWCDYSSGQFAVELPVGDLGTDGDVSRPWTVWIRVEAAGLVAEQALFRPVRSGTIGIPALPLTQGERLVPEWRDRQPLRLHVVRGAAVAAGLDLTGRVLSGTLRPQDVERIERITVGHGAGPVDARWADPDDTGRRFAVELPTEEPPGVEGPRTWTVTAWNREGRRLVMTTPEQLGGSGTGHLVLDTNRKGCVVVTEWRAGAVADAVAVSPEGLLTVRGRVLGERWSRVRLRIGHGRAAVRGETTALSGGGFAAAVRLEREVYRFGNHPLPDGDHALLVELLDDNGETVEARLRVSRALEDELPRRVESLRLEGRFVLHRGTSLRLHLHRPIGASRGQFAQHQLHRRTLARPGLIPAVLMRSRAGDAATAHVDVHAELRRRGCELPVYWAVRDHSVPVPDGGIAVVENTDDWYDLLLRAQYYLDDARPPAVHRSREGQVVVQTPRAYPFESPPDPGLQAAASAACDHLVSPAPFATPLLRRELGYDGDVLEIGSPRNDALLSPRAEEIRSRTRASVGIEPAQTAVLYAPVLREPAPDGSPTTDLLDLEAAARALGDRFVLLVRGPDGEDRPRARLDRVPGCRDVTDYPEAADLLLAADAVVLDYSPLRFDVGVTGAPMLFHVPDLAVRRESRHWLVDFEATAPGPLVDTTDDVVAGLRDLDAVAREHTSAYARFRADYLALEDGHAAARLVDAVFVPRGDA